MVTWRPSAEQRLAQLWTAGPDRAAITAAANTIDRELADDPDIKGEAREGQTRLLVEAPLAVYYDVKEPDRLVIVWDVWRWGPTP
jgi:hypothetical protein